MAHETAWGEMEMREERGGAWFAGIDRNPKDKGKARRLLALLEDRIPLGDWAVLQGYDLLSTAWETVKAPNFLALNRQLIVETVGLTNSLNQFRPLTQQFDYSREVSFLPLTC